jgi:hypothetical protein
MNKATMWAVIAIVMAVAGALTGKRKGGHHGFGAEGRHFRHGPRQVVKVKLTDDGNGKCTIKPKNKPDKVKLSKRDEDYVEWQIHGGKCYAKDPDAIVQVHFDKAPVPDPIPVIPERPDGRETFVAQVNKRAMVNQEGEAYHYSLWLIPGPGKGDPYLLMDPELILEP